MAVSLASVGDNCIDRYTAPVEQAYVGGNAVNVAVGLAQAGRPVMYAGSVGADADGRAVLAALAAAGVDTSHVVVQDDQETGVTLVELTHDGDRIFVEERLGTSGTYQPDAAALRAIQACDWVHAVGLHADPEVLTRIPGPRISYDFAQHHRDLLPRLAPCLEIAFFSATGAAMPWRSPRTPSGGGRAPRW